MKTQFAVTITQTGEREKMPPATVERELRNAVKAHFVTNEEGTVSATVRHVMDDTEPAADTLEALVREYGNAPTTGKGRTRANVLEDIRALMPVPGSQVAPNSAKPSVPVEDAVATLNTVMEDKGPDVTVSRKELCLALSDAHRAGQLTGRRLGKEGRELANAHADQAMTALVMRNTQ